MKKIWEMFFVLLSSKFCAKRSQHYLGHVLPMFVCLSQLFVAAPLGWFWWNFTQITLSKIWEDTFLIFWKFWLNDVITAFFMISFAALSRLQVHDKFLQIDISCSSAHDIVWDCKSAFSVNFFNPIWPTKMAKMTVKIKICVKLKTKHPFVSILSRWWRIWPYFLRR